MAKSYYDILGVSRNASEKDIRSAYRKLARQYHPDVNPGDAAAEAKFKEINEAYQVLSNAENRKKYDQFGEHWRHSDQFAGAGAAGSPFTGGSPFTWFSRSSRRGGSRQTRDADDLGGLGDLLGDLLSGGGRTRTTVEDFPPQQTEVAVTVTMEEAYSGTKRKVQLPPDPLSGSHGRTIEVNIPAGVQSGSRIHVGVPDRSGAPVDLYLRVTVSPHPLFERKGDGLLVTVNVPMLDAVLGGEVEVPTITGRRVALKLPPLTQNGKVFRLKGKGMPRRDASGIYGDLLATVKVVMPTRLTDEQRTLFERLRDLGTA